MTEGQSPEQPLPSDNNKQPTGDRRASRRTFLRGALGLTAGAALSSLSGDAPASPTSTFIVDPEIPTSEKNLNVPEYKSERELYDPTHEEIATVEKLFDKPGSLSVERTKDMSPEEIAHAYTKAKIKIAKKHGLTMDDYHPLYRELFSDAHKEVPQYDFQTYLTNLQKFLQQGGIQITPGTDNKQSSNNEQPLDKQTREQALVKRSLVTLIPTIGELPVELIHTLGIKKIVLVKTGEEEAGHADLFEKGTVYIDPTRGSGRIYTHEAYHAHELSRTSYGEATQDTNFRDFNPVQIYTKEDAVSENRDGKYISDEEYSQFEDQVTAELNTAKINGETKTVQRIENDLTQKATNVVTATNFGFNNIAEDKAEIGSLLLDSSMIGRLLDRKKPILRKKTLFLLARLYHKNPNIVTFLADVRQLQ